MINEMMQAATKAQVGYMQCGEPTPHLEFVMHPRALMDLKLELSTETNGLLNRCVDDGRYEFMNHVIRENSDQAGWILQPIKSMERDK